MNKVQALQAFWSSFGLAAFDEQSAYDERTELPENYITYEPVLSNLTGETVSMTASLWYHTTSWAAITQKADAIAAAIGYGGKVLRIDGGYIWIMQGTPFAQPMAAERDDYRRMILNIQAAYMTAT